MISTTSAAGLTRFAETSKADLSRMMAAFAWAESVA
jgi:hypothetical protein